MVGPALPVAPNVEKVHVPACPNIDVHWPAGWDDTTGNLASHKLVAMSENDKPSVRVGERLEIATTAAIVSNIRDVSTLFSIVCLTCPCPVASCIEVEAHLVVSAASDSLAEVGVVHMKFTI